MPTGPQELAVVIPAYNESATIRDVARRALGQCENVIVVDDGSTDGTADCLADLNVRLIRHETNLRKAAALWNGMRAAIDAGAQAVITLDGDGQHRPEDIPILVRAADKHAGSIVIGSRLHQGDDIPMARWRANRVANFWISWAAGYAIQDSQSGFRLYPAALLQELNLGTGVRRGFVFESEILIEAANRGVKSVAVKIPAIYSDGLRPSHFRPVADITSITLMVSSRLIRRGLFLPGLYRSFIRPELRRRAPPSFDGDALLALVLSLLVAALTLGVGFLWFLYRVHRTAAAAPTEVQDCDAAIVLGHQLIAGHLSDTYRARLDRVLQLCRDHQTMDVHIAGGRSSDGLTEADAGYRYLMSREVNADRLHRENLSSNTVENLKQIKSLMSPYRRVIVVSSRYHLERVASLSAGMGMSFVACGAEPTYRFGEVFPHSLVEAFFLHWYWAGRTFGELTSNARILGKIGR